MHGEQDQLLDPQAQVRPSQRNPPEFRRRGEQTRRGRAHRGHVRDVRDNRIERGEAIACGRGLSLLRGHFILSAPIAGAPVGPAALPVANRENSLRHDLVQLP